MITVLPEKNKEKISEIFKKYNLPMDDYSGYVTAKDREEVLGYCLYSLDDKKIVIFFIEPKNDIMLADGILRSALHVAAEKSIMNAFYSETAPEELFEKLDFIKSKEDKTLNIDKLFGSCCSCG